MSAFVLIPGAASDSWYWHLVAPRLEAAGHDVVSVDLPVDDDTAGFAEYADAAVEAIDDRSDLVVVGQSMGAFTATLVCERLPAKLLVLVAAMVPRVGETGGEWWVNTGHADARRELNEREGFADPDSPETMFLHDVPPHVVDESLHHVREQSSTPFERPFPLRAWPDVPVRFLACRHDRFLPLELQRRVVRDRLGFDPDEMDGGHLPALSRPDDLAERLLAYAAEAD